MRHKRDMGRNNSMKTARASKLQIRAIPAVASSGFAKRYSFVIARCRSTGVFPGSSVVEQPAVNRLVAGSNPARGAKNFSHFQKSSGYFVRDLIGQHLGR